MKSLLLSLGLLFLLLVDAQAAFTDFEDLTLGTHFAADETIHSKALSFDVVNFNDIGSAVIVRQSAQALGDGVELSIATDLGLSFQLPVGVERVSLLYNSFKPNSGIVVNGVASPLSIGFGSLDGSTFAGVSVTANVVFEDLPFQGQGELILSGPISSLIVGGSELRIDNVTVSIPEPSTAALLLSTSVFAIARRRRRI